MRLSAYAVAAIVVFTIPTGLALGYATAFAPDDDVLIEKLRTQNRANTQAAERQKAEVKKMLRRILEEKKE